MAVERLSAAEVAIETIEASGLDEAVVDLRSPEVLASLLRRAASFTCPVPSGHLVRSVAAALEGVADDPEELTRQLEDLVEALIGYGDLLELPVVDDARLQSRRQLFLGPPSFVERRSGACLLLGIPSDGTPLLGEELATTVEYEGHVRSIAAREDLSNLLRAQGLRELKEGEWLERPRRCSAQDVVDQYEARLAAAGPAGEITDFRIIDRDTPVTYYRGRWRSPTRRDTGMFVARRPQAFGAELWCFAQVADGTVARLIDLPVRSPTTPGRDEAWWLQAAIDGTGRSPQRIRIREVTGSTRLVIDLFSPVPSWAQRRLDAIGTPLLRGRGALMSYSLEATEVEEEVAFLSESLWMLAEWS